MGVVECLCPGGRCDQGQQQCLSGDAWGRALRLAADGEDEFPRHGDAEDECPDCRRVVSGADERTRGEFEIYLRDGRYGSSFQEKAVLLGVRLCGRDRQFRPVAILSRAQGRVLRGLRQGASLYPVAKALGGRRPCLCRAGRYRGAFGRGEHGLEGRLPPGSGVRIAFRYPSSFIQLPFERHLLYA